MRKKQCLIALLALVCILALGACTTQNGTSANPGTTNGLPTGTTNVKPEPTATTAPEPTVSPDVPTCSGHDSDPYENVDKAAFYDNYTTACCYVDAQYRSAHYLMSGSLEVPGQYPTVAENQPMQDGIHIRNTDSRYLDGGTTYVVVDETGREVLRVYKGGAYITLDEVAAYMYAFGGNSIPANYDSNKSAKPANSQWGIYLRVNHSSFSGNTFRFPYEPELPNISGCGGSLRYYEMDIGTTGTRTDGYAPALYNNGTSITRGAARIVYARMDLDHDGVFAQDEVYVFYTANHYNDFQEYLNYYGGWGKIFGNITGGGTLSSKVDYHPTQYEAPAYASFRELFQNAA